MAMSTVESIAGKYHYNEGFYNVKLFDNDFRKPEIFVESPPSDWPGSPAYFHGYNIKFAQFCQQPLASVLLRGGV